MEFKTYNNLNDCARIWSALSANQKIFDFWDFRRCFFSKDSHKPHFIVGKDKGKIAGVLPLWLDISENEYNYFGGWFPERNSFFASDGSKISELLSKSPDKTSVEGIDPREIKYYNFSGDEYTFYLDLARYGYSFDNYFSSFDKKKQKNFKRDLKRIPKYRIHVNKLRDFDRLVDLNINQFEEDSIFNKKSTRNGILKMIKLAHKRGILRMLSLEINKKTEAIDVGVQCGEWYHVVTGSSNNQKIPNIGKLMTVLSIKNAIAKKARYVDFLASSGYWKSFWGFEKEMLLKFEK